MHLVLLIFTLVATLYGFAVGSFLNVVIYRVPRDLSIVKPPSACPKCSTPIRWYDNIPVVSWLVLRGRCRACGAPISPRYLVVELAGGALFAGSAVEFGAHWDAVAFMALFAGLLALSWIDIEHLRLPTKIVYTTTGIVAALLLVSAAWDGQWHRLFIAVICSAVWFVFFFLLNFFAPKYLGFGDVRLSVVLGLSLGWLGVGYVFVGFFAANFIGLLISLALIATKRMKRDQSIPYGVYLSLAVLFMTFVGPTFMPAFSTFVNQHR
jgi:leader peptidase (prepilin peptidase)/N-methyltransferase